MWKSKKEDKDASAPMGELFKLEEELVDHIPASERLKAKILLVLDLLVNIAIIIVLVAVVRKFLISPFQVFGPSMCNTLNFLDEKCQHGFGEYLIVNKAVYQNFFGLFKGKPQHGDIVVFKPQEESKDFYIKRIIGVPGDKIEISKNEVYITYKGSGEKQKLPEPYLNESNMNNTQTFSLKSIVDFEVPENSYFVLGDNRKESTDSRTCFLPPFSKKCTDDKHFLPKDRIEGKAWIVLWPFTKMRILKKPDYALAVK